MRANVSSSPLALVKGEEAGRDQTTPHTFIFVSNLLGNDALFLVPLAPIPRPIAVFNLLHFVCARFGRQ
jgi:hypothetical protein